MKTLYDRITHPNKEKLPSIAVTELQSKHFWTDLSVGVAFEVCLHLHDKPLDIMLLANTFVESEKIAV